jgi:hypothetical protein
LFGMGNASPGKGQLRLFHRGDNPVKYRKRC